MNIVDGAQQVFGKRYIKAFNILCRQSDLLTQAKFRQFDVKIIQLTEKVCTSFRRSGQMDRVSGVDKAGFLQKQQRPAAVGRIVGDGHRGAIGQVVQ